MLGAYAPVLAAQLGWPGLMALPLSIVMVAGWALLVERLVVRHLYDRAFDSLLATWALSIVMRELAEMIWGRSFRNVALPIETVAQIGPVAYPAYRLWVIGLVLASFVGLYVWYRRSLAAVRIRAMVANPALAQASGINTDRLAAASFVTGCVLAGLAGAYSGSHPGRFAKHGAGCVDPILFCAGGWRFGTLEGLGIGAVVVGGCKLG